MPRLTSAALPRSPATNTPTPLGSAAVLPALLLVGMEKEGGSVELFHFCGVGGQLWGHEENMVFFVIL